MTRLLKVAVIGQGFMGRAHSFAWQRVSALSGDRPRPQLQVLCGRDGAALSENGSRWGYSRVSTSWRETVESDDVDVVDICTPGASHSEIALLALAAGKHVLCEKPLANSLGEAHELALAAKRAEELGVIAMVGFNYRRVPAVVALRTLVQSGELGEIRHVRASYLQDWLVDPEVPLAWRLRAEEAGSGALGDLGAHVIDLVRYVTNDELVEVVGTTKTFVLERPIPESSFGLAGKAAPGAIRGAVTVDDAFTALARMGGGCLATLEATRMAPGHKNALSLELNGSMASAYFELERLNELAVGGRDGGGGVTWRMVTDPTDPYLAQWWPPGHVLGWEHTFVHEIQDLVAGIGASRKVEPSFEDGLATQAVLDAVSQSAQRHTWIPVVVPTV